MACGDRWGFHGEELPKLLELLLELGSEARVVGDHHVLVIVLARLLRPIEAAVEEDDAVQNGKLRTGGIDTSEPQFTSCPPPRATHRDASPPPAPHLVVHVVLILEVVAEGDPRLAYPLGVRTLAFLLLHVGDHAYAHSAVPVRSPWGDNYGRLPLRRGATLRSPLSTHVITLGAGLCPRGWPVP